MHACLTPICADYIAGSTQGRPLARGELLAPFENGVDYVRLYAQFVDAGDMIKNKARFGIRLLKIMLTPLKSGFVGIEVGTAKMAPVRCLTRERCLAGYSDR